MDRACRDLIGRIRAPHRKARPAIVRRTGDAARPHGVVSGAPRHVAVHRLRAAIPTSALSWRCAPPTDEPTSRRSDIETRDHTDISEVERTRDRLVAVDACRGGGQKDLAARIGVSPRRSSCRPQLALLLGKVAAAFASIAGLRRPRMGPARSRRSRTPRDMSEQRLAPAAPVIRFEASVSRPSVGAPRRRPTGGHGAGRASRSAARAASSGRGSARRARGPGRRHHRDRS